MPPAVGYVSILDLLKQAIVRDAEGQAEWQEVTAQDILARIVDSEHSCRLDAEQKYAGRSREEISYHAEHQFFQTFYGVIQHFPGVNPAKRHVFTVPTYVSMLRLIETKVYFSNDRKVPADFRELYKGYRIVHSIIYKERSVNFRIYATEAAVWKYYYPIQKFPGIDPEGHLKISDVATQDIFDPFQVVPGVQSEVRVQSSNAALRNITISAQEGPVIVPTDDIDRPIISHRRSNSARQVRFEELPPTSLPVRPPPPQARSILPPPHESLPPRPTHPITYPYASRITSQPLPIHQVTSPEALVVGAPPSCSESPLSPPTTSAMDYPTRQSLSSLDKIGSPIHIRGGSGSVNVNGDKEVLGDVRPVGEERRDLDQKRHTKLATGIESVEVGGRALGQKHLSMKGMMGKFHL